MHNRSIEKIEQYKHQSGQCCWCLRLMDLPGTTTTRSPTFPSWEHIYPRSLGGGDQPWNRVLAHSKCNSERGLNIKVKPLFQSYVYDR